MKHIPPSAFSAFSTQEKRIIERRGADTKTVCFCDFDIATRAGVYEPGGDTELLMQSASISEDESFLEVGCGSGAIAVALAKKARAGLGVDINPAAVDSSTDNARLHGIKNVTFKLSDVFSEVKDKFDVIVCNPPYSNRPAADEVERMFWDPDDGMKERFFQEAINHLNPGGRIYFGWADFKDLDTDLPLRLAEQNGYVLKETFTKPHQAKGFKFYVLLFQRK